MSEVVVPPARFARWADNFTRRHGPAELSVERGALAATARDGSTFSARLPFDASYDGPADPVAFAGAAVPPPQWGVLLARKGGFAIALLTRDRLVRHKIGQRHVQGRTKAGGQSQQRFARRRDNQARQAYAAASGHAADILGTDSDLVVVTGGDRSAIREVLSDARLAGLRPTSLWLAVPDPNRAVLDGAVEQARGLLVVVTNAA